MTESDHLASTAGTAELSARAPRAEDDLEMEDRGAVTNGLLLVRRYEESTDLEDTLNVVSVLCLKRQSLMSSGSISSCNHSFSFALFTCHLI